MDRAREIGLYLSELIYLNATVRERHLDTTVFLTPVRVTKKRQSVYEGGNEQLLYQIV